MLCSVCGLEHDDACACCPSCGVENEAAPAPPKKRSKLIIILPIVAALIVVSAGAYFLLAGLSPEAKLKKALTNFRADSIARLEASPVGWWEAIYDCLEQGRIEAQISQSGYSMDEMTYRVTLDSDLSAREFALTADAAGPPLAASLYFNRERAALQTNLLGDQFYGITYGTFRSDVGAFAALLGLDDATVEELATWVDWFSATMNREASEGTGADSRYATPVLAFLDDIKTESGTETVDGVSCTTVRYTADARVAFQLLADLCVLLREDLAMQASVSGVGDYLDAFDDFEAQLQYALTQVEGTIALAFYIGPGDKLVRTALLTDLAYDGQTTGINLTFDTVGDCWTLRILQPGLSPETYFVEVAWEHSAGASVVDKLNFFFVYGHPTITLTLDSDWNPETGAFTFLADDSWDVTAATSISGNFTKSDSGFRFQVGQPGDSMQVQLNGSKGVTIDRPAFVNLDEWDMTLLTQLYGALFGSLMPF